MKALPFSARLERIALKINWQENISKECSREK